MITNEDLDKFKLLYREHFGEEIADQEAMRKGIKLVELMKMVYKPIRKNTRLPG